MSKFSAGCIYYYPSFHHIHNPVQTEKLQKDLKRYLTRKIGFEAVMRIRCTKGMYGSDFQGRFCSVLGPSGVNGTCKIYLRIKFKRYLLLCVPPTPILSPFSTIPT